MAYTKNPNHKISKVFFAVLLSLFYIIPAYPQENLERATRATDQLSRDAEQIERRLIQPPPKPKESVKEEVLEIPKEEKRFFIKKIKLTGMESFSPEEFASTLKNYEGRECTLTELNFLAKQLEREYLRKGILAVVFIPPQDIKDDTATLQVVEAKMGDLEIQPHKYFNNKRLRYYWQIEKGDPVRYDKISKSMQMMNKNPDRETKASLKAGKASGTTDIVLTTKTRFPNHIGATYDNEGTISTGKYRYGFSNINNNTLGFDDTSIAGYTYGKDFRGMYAYHRLPASPNGATVLYGFSTNRSQPKKDYLPFDMRSGSDDINISVYQDIYKKDEYLGEVFTGFTGRDKFTYANSGGTINRDRLRIVNLGTNFYKKAIGSTAVISAEIDQGLGFFGASPEENPMATRGAQSVFSKFTLGLNTKTKLPFGMQQNLKINSQFASARLNPSEEMVLGGIDSIRGYPSNDFLADNAILTNLEMLIPSIYVPGDWRLPYDSKSFRDQVTTVLFTDYGFGERRGEKKYHHLWGVGAGLRVNVYNQAVVRMELGYPIGDAPITAGEAWHFHFSVSFKDNLPEEIERIRQEIEEAGIKRAARNIVDDELSKYDSPIRRKIGSYLYMARKSYKEGDLKNTKKMYERTRSAIRSLYSQAEDYVRACAKQKKDLNQASKTAEQYYEEGRLEEAKELWQKIIDNAHLKTLTFQLK